MEEKKISEELKCTLALIELSIEVSYERVEFVFEQLKEGKESFYKDIEAVIHAALEKNDKYPTFVSKIGSNYEIVKNLSEEMQLEVDSFMLKEKYVQLDEFFNNPDKHKKIMFFYIKKYKKVDEWLWKAIFDSKVEVANEWLLALVPQAVMPFSMVDLIFQKLEIDRLSILKALNPEQRLSANQCTIIRRLYDEDIANSILKGRESDAEGALYQE